MCYVKIPYYRIFITNIAQKYNVFEKYFVI